MGPSDHFSLRYGSRDTRRIDFPWINGLSTNTPGLGRHIVFPLSSRAALRQLAPRMLLSQPPARLAYYICSASPHALEVNRTQENTWKK